jgi:hypothetical protein
MGLGSLCAALHHTRIACIEEIRRKKKVVLTVSIDGHRIGVFMDNEVGAVRIYNSFGADGCGSERVHKTVCDVVLSALG